MGYADYGDQAGQPLFYFHGFPSSRLEARILADEAALQNVRLIAVDRPGIGLSTHQANRQIVSWPDDLVALADALRIDRFSILGVSAGGPYALACACKIPSRLIACGVVSGVGYVGRLLRLSARVLPWLVLPIVARAFRDQQRAERALTWAARCWPKADQITLTVPHVQKFLAASVVEALRPGFRGAAYDAALLGRSWGIDLNRAAVPVRLWHGERDGVIRIAAARRNAVKLPKCAATYYPNDGHISVLVNHCSEILAALTS